VNRSTRARELVYLTQTDTTIGFVSQNSHQLDSIKQRPNHKRYITALPSLHTLKSHTRVPNIHKNRVRRAKHSTFIFTNMNSYRIIRDRYHLLLLDRLGWAYTTSANPSNKPYDEKFATKSADVIISSNHPNSTNPSSIYRLGKNRLIRVR